MDIERLKARLSVGDGMMQGAFKRAGSFLAPETPSMKRVKAEGATEQKPSFFPESKLQSNLSLTSNSSSSKGASRLSRHGKVWTT